MLQIQAVALLVSMGLDTAVLQPAIVLVLVLAALVLGLKEVGVFLMDQLILTV